MLPADVTVAILQHVPQRLRLSQCALVCRSWLAATVAATISVVAEPTRPAHMESLSRWLQHHGSGLSDLSIVDLQLQPDVHLDLDIPFSYLRQLQGLHLAGLVIKSSNSGGCSSSNSLGTGSWANLTALTSLHLDTVHVTLQSNGHGSGFNSITSLRRLVLSSIDLACEGLPSLAPLAQVTCLVLENIAHMEGQVQGIGQLSQLEHLKLATDNYDFQVLSSIPLSLTHLDLGRPGQGMATWDISTLRAPRLSELSALVHLKVRGDHCTCFDAQLLSKLVQLRHLSLGACQLKYNRKGVGKLLALLPGLSNLQHLDLFGSINYSMEPVHQYSALVSSSALMHLDLRYCWLPENAVLYMFRGQQCPALQHLRLGTGAGYFGGVVVPYAVRVNALDALIAACPALQELQLLDNVVDPRCWKDLSALEDLMGLSSLALAGGVMHNDSITLLTSLELPALRDLKVNADEFTIEPSGVLHLREFTQLTQLSIYLSMDCEDDLRLLFTDQNGLTRLPELIDESVQFTNPYD